MTRRPAAPAVDEDLQCLLCGAPAHAEFGDGEVVIWELCDSCNGVVQAAADRAAAWTVAGLTHNYADAHCGHPDSVGEFPVPGAVCPLCRPAVPGQLALDGPE